MGPQPLKVRWIAGLIALALTSSCAGSNAPTPSEGARFNRTEPMLNGDPYLSPNPALTRDYQIGSSGYIFQEGYGDFDPAWSADGQWLAFASNRDGDADIYVIRSDGTGLRNLTPDPSPVLATLLFLMDKSVETWPDWDPSGDQIYFASSRTNIMMNTTPMDIYRMNADGSEIVQLTDTVDMEGLPDISPDSANILFVSDSASGIYIFSMKADGSNVSQLTDEGDDNDMPDWSPAGAQILFQAAYDDNVDVYLMDPDGANLVRLTDDPAMDTQPVWSPDGTRIAFVSDRDGDLELYLMNANGGDLTQLTDNNVDDADPAWSPDGRRIAYRSATPGGDRIFTIKVDGGEIVQITEGPVSIPPEENAVYHLHRGLALYLRLMRYDEGDFDSVIEAFDRSIALDPSLGEAYLGRGMATLMRCEIVWMHAAGTKLVMMNENEDCPARSAAVSDIERALELGLAPGLVPGVENLVGLLR